MAVRYLADRIKDMQESIKNEADSATTTTLLPPLSQRVQKLLASLPPAELQSGISIEALACRLSGRQRKSCHRGELGAVLRSLGFHRTRNYSRDSETGYSTLWRLP